LDRAALERPRLVERLGEVAALEDALRVRDAAETLAEQAGP
jgi:hypothetical protein